MHSGRTVMSELVVIGFSTEAKAEEVRQKLLAMQKEYLIELGDAVVAVKDSNGYIKLNQMINMTAAGAVTGAFWGSLIGLIFLMPLAGAALGAASGTLSYRHRRKMDEGDCCCHPPWNRRALRTGAQSHRGQSA